MSDNSQRRGILAAGNFVVDTVKIIDAWPAQDTLCSIQSRTSCNGGGAYNILKNLSKLDPSLPLEACGLLGGDVEGQWVLNDCYKTGIDTSQLHRQDGLSTSVTDAMTVTDTGRRTFFHERGANAELDVRHFDFSRTEAKIFSFGYIMLLDRLDVLNENSETGAAAVLSAARKAGMITAVDAVSSPNPKFKDVAVASLKEADVFFVNELEAGWIVGYEVTLDNLEQAIRDLAAMGSSGVVVIHMPQAAMAYSTVEDIEVFQPTVAIPKNIMQGATGAGDAFATGFLYGVHEGWTIQKSLQAAVCVAAMSLTHGTPSDGVRLISECFNFGKIHGYRSRNLVK